MKNALNDKDLTDLQNKLDDAKDSGTEDDKDACSKSQNALSFQCFLAPALLKVTQDLIGVGTQLLGYYGQAAIDAKLNGGTTPKSGSGNNFNMFSAQNQAQQQAMIQQAIQQYNASSGNNLGGTNYFGSNNYGVYNRIGYSNVWH